MPSAGRRSLPLSPASGFSPMDDPHDPFASIIFECIIPPEAQEALRHAPEVVEPGLCSAISRLNCRTFPIARNPDTPSENQMLPDSPLSQIDKGNFNGAPTRTESSSSSIPERTLPLDNFIDLVKHFSLHSDRSLGDKDILEIAERKGIHFPPPEWWRTGGYKKVP
ncbi:uncharacterized protein LOC110022403 [Phalaenopsis equestris]|uniref:uncharacterized protein LOC110022403 n=1 Tax=Phalaenopsis equestris TaxID=78828 RepID=UPI0009E63FCB|nr:uncharacterized protein LOC110022403 [Phalaenopsis equestris]